jgi:hypothetical protein
MTFRADLSPIVKFAFRSFFFFFFVVLCCVVCFLLCCCGLFGVEFMVYLWSLSIDLLIDVSHMFFTSYSVHN